MKLAWLGLALMNCGSPVDLGTPNLPDGGGGGGGGSGGAPMSDAGACTYNRASYPVGASFPQGDGCNTCTCFAPDDLRCTRCACIQTDAGPVGCGSHDPPDAADAADAQNDVPPGATCSADSASQCFGLLGGCPQKLDDAAIAQMCTARNGRVKVGTQACGGVLALLTAGLDCDFLYVFDATTKELVETASGCNGYIACSWSVSGAPLAPSCIYRHAGLWFTDAPGEFGLEPACNADASTD
jgi:hypothetical protein